MIKNNSNVVDISKYHVLIAAASRLAMVCFTNGLGLYTGYGVEKNNPYMEFKVYAGPEEIILYSGKIFGNEDEMMNAIIDSIAGKMVSEVSPPAETIFDGQKVIYWKRELVNRIDATRLGGNRSEVTQSKAQISWVGFDVNHKEVVRKFDGVSNPGHELVARVEYVELGPLGTVVAVVPRSLIKDETHPPSIGESIWLKDKKDSQDAVELAEANAAALRSDQILGLGTTNIAAMTPEALGLMEESRSVPTSTGVMIDGILTQSNGAVTATGLPIRYYITLSNVRVVIPEPLDKGSFVSASPEQRAEYLEFIAAYRKLVGGKEFKKSDPDSHGRMCQFLRDAVESNIFDSEYIDYLGKNIRCPLEDHLTRVVFTAALFKIDQVEVMEELYHLDQNQRPEPTKEVDLPELVSVPFLAKMLSTTTELVIKAVGLVAAPVTVDDVIDRGLAENVVKCMGYKLKPLPESASK